VRVWISDWQWECCGEPFSVGDSIEWGLLPETSDGRASLTGPLGVDVADAITHFYEAHPDEDDEQQPIATPGRIESVEAVYWQYASRPGSDSRTRYPVEGSGVTEPRSKVDGWESERPDRREFVGYIVSLSPVN
jgi:hypothetical protein